MHVVQLLPNPSIKSHCLVQASVYCVHLFFIHVHRQNKKMQLKISSSVNTFAVFVSAVRPVKPYLVFFVQNKWTQVPFPSWPYSHKSASLWRINSEISGQNYREVSIYLRLFLILWFYLDALLGRCCRSNNPITRWFLGVFHYRVPSGTSSWPLCYLFLTCEKTYGNGFWRTHGLCVCAEVVRGTRSHLRISCCFFLLLTRASELGDGFNWSSSTARIVTMHWTQLA